MSLRPGVSPTKHTTQGGCGIGPRRRPERVPSESAERGKGLEYEDDARRHGQKPTQVQRKGVTKAMRLPHDSMASFPSLP